MVLMALYYHKAKLEWEMAFGDDITPLLHRERLLLYGGALLTFLRDARALIALVHTKS